jgi:hypothetical protein
MARSTFSQLGLPLGENKINMTYLYGLSDFFSVMFENPDKVNLLLETQSEVASETYSRFLQMASTVSLEDIQKTSGQTLKLVTIKTTDAVFGEVNTYTLPVNMVSSRYIANRPLLPSALMEENVDYRVEVNADGSSRIRFSTDISTAGFSTRLLPDEVTKEYALWFVDSEIDEEWIATYFGDLIGLTPEASSDTFRNFVYGLYYVYANGPALDLIRKGLNLALGIPLARGTETVLEIRKYLGTDQYVVVTDLNQYFIPYGLPPVVAEGDVLQVSDEIARWVEVKDYVNDGDWWINLQIPASIIPSVPPGQKDRYATTGSHFDYLMRNYLKKHTFLVNVKVTSFKETQLFEQLSQIIKTAKPAYTDPIYIWTVSQEEVLTFNDDQLALRWDQFRCENLNSPIDKFYRANYVTPLKRGCPTFTRFTAPNSVSKLCGTDPYTNGTPDTFLGGAVTGYVNTPIQIRKNTGLESAWLKTINSRATETVNGKRSRVGFYRNAVSLNQTTNLVKYSQDFSNAAWTLNNTTLTPNSVITPDGTMTGSTLAKTTTGNAYISQVITNSNYSGKTIILSVYLKAGTNTVGTYIRIKSNTGVEFASQFVTPTSEFKRYILPITVPTGASDGVTIYIDPNENLGTTTDNIYAYGVQLEENFEVTEYVKTLGVIGPIYQSFNSGIPVQTTANLAKVTSNMRIVPLYVTTQTDLRSKCNTLGIRTPDLVEWTFNFLNTISISEEIDALAINEGVIDTNTLQLANNFNIAFFRGTNVNYLSNIMPLDSFNSWAPPDASAVRTGDYLIGIRIQGEVLGMYWVTSNFDIQTPYFNIVKETDSLLMTTYNRPLRGFATMGAPYYNLRGRGALSYNTTGLDINAIAINEGGVDATITIVNTYSDTINVSPITFTRDGTQAMNHQMELN